MLRWYVPRLAGVPPTATTDHEHYYAPSWSWAATTGCVKFRSIDEQMDEETSGIKIWDLFCVPAAVNRHVPVSYGAITLEGDTLPVKIHKNTSFIPINM